MEIAIIGLGSMGQIHLKTARSLPAVRHIHCVTSRPERFRELPDVDATSDLDTALRHAEAAIVAVPASHHLEVTRPLLKAGIPVLLEKPMAATLREAEVLAEAAEASKTLLFIGHHERFGPALTTARPLLQAPKQIISFKTKPYTERNADVGMVTDTLYHDLYMLRSFPWFHPASSSLRAATSSLVSAHDDVAIVEWKGEALRIHLHANRLAAEERRTWYVATDDELITIDFKTFEIIRYRLPGDGENRALTGRRLAAIQEEAPAEKVAAEHWWPITAEQEHFFAAVEGREEPKVSLDDGLATMRLVEQILTAAGRPGPG